MKKNERVVLTDGDLIELSVSKNAAGPKLTFHFLNNNEEKEENDNHKKAKGENGSAFVVDVAKKEEEEKKIVMLEKENSELEFNITTLKEGIIKANEK